MADESSADACYGPGSVAGAVLGTFLVTLALLASALFFYKIYSRTKKGKHLVLVSDAENPQDQYAFDNPCFREATPIKRNVPEEKQSWKPEKIKWPGWPPVHTFGKEQKSEKITSMDDSNISDSRMKVVTLKSHDFTGLGFNICGNMRDGIFVKDVLHRGPAFESGCINPGDRIDSVCISFRNMVFEDALTILSYASPYDVQVQVENDSYSRPSTLMRSKRESNAVNSSDRILHPKFSRSQSIAHLNEIGRNGYKKLGHQIGFMLEKNRANNSINKYQEADEVSTLKALPSGNEGKNEKLLAPGKSPLVSNKTSPRPEKRFRDFEAQQTKGADPQNKFQKLGIKVLPITINPKMGVQSVAGSRKSSKSPPSPENDINSRKEMIERTGRQKELSRNSPSPEEKSLVVDETDAGRENVKAMLTKGFLTLKEKINQNTLGKKKKVEEESGAEEEGKGESGAPTHFTGHAAGRPTGHGQAENECPVPKHRSSVPCGVKAYEQNQQNHMCVPEEVSKAGDVARLNRKSAAEGRKVLTDLESEDGGQESKSEWPSDSEGSSDRESVRDETRRPKRSKGKAPSPPKQNAPPKDINEIKNESELSKDDMSIFEPETKTPASKEEDEEEGSLRPSYDSDSDAEPTTGPGNGSGNTKIELTSTQVTVHQSPSGDANEEEVEPSRKAASLGDLSKLDSEQPLSIVLERAVSLDLTEGSSHCGKKRKAPLPPSEEFPAAFDDLNYRKEPRLEGLNTFQRLKKSSDFGTLEDALCDGPKSLEIQVDKCSPLDLKETHSNNIQEFSTWLAECRRPKGTEEEPEKNVRDKPKISSTSFVNINSSRAPEKDVSEDKYDYQVFSVNGRNFPDFEIGNSPNARTVVVISQPNSLEPIALDKAAAGEVQKESANGTDDRHSENDPAPPKLPSTPIPASNTLSSPLSSTLTYITEIKVSTSKPGRGTPSPNSIADRIQKFDSFKAFDGSPANSLAEPSKIPMRTMKSETGQKVLATIQSLAKEPSPAKTAPEIEYAKRMAALFSNPQNPRAEFRKHETKDGETPHPNVSSTFLRTSPPKPSKDYSPTRKVPPVVPPRKMETFLAAKSEHPSAEEDPDTNPLTFSSFVERCDKEDTGGASEAPVHWRQRGEMNGSRESPAPASPSATKIVFESKSTGTRALRSPRLTDTGPAD